MKENLLKSLDKRTLLKICKNLGIELKKQETMPNLINKISKFSFSSIKKAI